MVHAGAWGHRLAQTSLPRHPPLVCRAAPGLAPVRRPPVQPSARRAWYRLRHRSPAPAAVRGILAVALERLAVACSQTISSHHPRLSEEAPPPLVLDRAVKLQVSAFR
jgi:hypothetical protein